MPTFKSEDAIMEYLLSKSEDAMKNARDKIERTIDKYLLQYYGEYQPEMYLRTSQLLNSLIKTPVTRNGNTIRTSVYFDANALNYSNKPRVYINGRYNEKNQTYSQGKEYTLSAKPDPYKTLEAAMSGSHGGHKEGTDVWDASMAELKSIVDLIVDELRAAGIPVK